jgi:hypothetical protein
MLTLIENTVRVTIRHSDTRQIASEAATAPASLDEATGADGPSKPAAVGDRIMAEFLQRAGESPATDRKFRKHRRQYCGGKVLKMAKSRRIRPLCPLFRQFYQLF